VAALDTPVMYVKGVGPRVALLLAGKGIETAEDLLYHLPFRYEDRQNPRSLDELQPGEMASVIAEVRGSTLLRTHRAPLFELTVGQGRLALKCIWFNGSYL
jgi:ATP-dependent DNA helicase RecG